MDYTPHGKHLIAGKWVLGNETFANEPVSGSPVEFQTGNPTLIDMAVKEATVAFIEYRETTRAKRAEFLNAIATNIEKRKADIVGIATTESGLPEARIIGETGRTTGQLRLFATHIENGDYLDRRFDAELPDRAPLPRPDLRMMQVPVGPVAVFGASNFPLAFSVAGGDTASALAAGCPVIVKGHSAHPGTSEIVAEAILEAMKECGIHPGVFSLIQGGDRTVGSSLVQHDDICAVGFTGSLGGGRALFDLCAARKKPIPFFGELGSINPVFVLDNAMNTRAQEIAEGWAASMTMGAGQFCTKPGVCVVLDGPKAQSFGESASAFLKSVASQTMLTSTISSAFKAGRDKLQAIPDIKEWVVGDCSNRSALASLFQTTGDKWLADTDLHEEIFGPLGLIIVARDFEQMLEIANTLEGQLTCTLQIDPSDNDKAKQLLPILVEKAGRVLANGFSTGVEVSDTMVHSGPFPASTNFGATSVGTMAIRRFLRPVCYQNIPAELLPSDLT